MPTDVTQVMMDEHQLILRMISLVEKHTDRLEAGAFRDWNFYLNAVDFIRNFADRFHHAKEESILFVELVENGMPARQSPIEAMLMEHEQGRDLVRRMEDAARRLLDSENGSESALAEAARGYATLLREHIAKEDLILYPLAERILPEAVRGRMLDAYAAAAGEMPGLEERYRNMVESYEAESTAWNHLQLRR